MIGTTVVFLLSLLASEISPTAINGTNIVGAAPPLYLEEVLQSLRSTHPDLEVAEEKVNMAKAKRFAARGAWDPNLEVQSQWSPLGYYQNGHVDTRIRQATPLWGIGVHMGYRLGWGNHPIYKGNLETLSGGELRAGIDVPLAKDGPIDRNRAEIKRNKYLSRASECKRQSIQLKLGQLAAKAYWKWVASGQELLVQRELLAVARTRDTGLREQAQLGSIPKIDIVDNQRLVLERQSKLIQAQQKFQSATLELSLYLRNGQQEPIRVHENRLPLLDRNIGHYLFEPNHPQTDIDAEKALQRRPEMCELRQELTAARVQLRLAKNQQAPQINAQAFVARDIGSGAEELEATQLGVGLSVSLPLLQRKARGNHRAAQAVVRQWNAKFRSQRDRIIAELHQARVDLSAATKQIEVAQQQVKAAKELAEAERQKLLQGASNLVIVNLREIAAADAARQEIAAITGFQYALVDYLSVSGKGLWYR